MHPRLEELLTESANDFITHFEPGLDVFESLNRNEEDASEIGEVFAKKLRKLLAKLRKQYFKTHDEARVHANKSGTNYHHRQTSMGKFLSYEI